MIRDTQLREILDRQEISEALATYCRLADLNRPQEQVACFTDDCRVSYGGPDRWIEGRDALVVSLTRALAAYSATSHVLGLPEFAFASEQGDAGPARAQVSTAVHAWHRRRDGGPDFLLYGRYVDEWWRTESGWRLAVREFRAAGAVGRDEGALNPLGRTG
jgi:hypothetical protein